jgi:hypothetical protein
LGEVESKIPNYKGDTSKKDIEKELGFSLPKLSDDEIKNITGDIDKILKELANESIPKNIVKDIIKEIKEKYGFPFSPNPKRCPESPDPYRALPPEYYDIIIENIVNDLILKLQPPPPKEIYDRFANGSYVFRNKGNVMDQEEILDFLKRYGHYLNEHLPLPMVPIQQQFKQPVELIQCEKKNCLKKQTF